MNPDRQTDNSRRLGKHRATTEQRNRKNRSGSPPVFMPASAVEDAEDRLALSVAQVVGAIVGAVAGACVGLNIAFFGMMFGLFFYALTAAGTTFKGDSAALWLFGQVVFSVTGVTGILVTVLCGYYTGKLGGRFAKSIIRKILDSFA